MAWSSRLRRRLSVNALSIRWLFVAVASTAIAVTAILNANELWRDATRVVLVSLIGVALVTVIAHRGRASFALGFAVFSILAHWLSASPDPGAYSADSFADIGSVGSVLHDFVMVAWGVGGGLVSKFATERAAGRTASMLMLMVQLSLVAVCAAALIATAVVQANRLVAEQKQQDEDLFPPDDGAVTVPFGPSGKLIINP